MAQDKFEEYVKKNQEKFVHNTEGSFDCQTCDEYVDKGYYDRTARLLVWKCSEGHISHVKEISL